MICYLMWITVYYRLLFELELARILSSALDAHGTIMITIDLTKDDVVYRSGNLAPFKSFSIFKLKRENANRIKLNRTPPEFALEIGVSPEFPASALTVTSNNHWVMTHLSKSYMSDICNARIQKYKLYSSQKIIAHSYKNINYNIVYLFSKKVQAFIWVVSLISLS